MAMSTADLAADILNRNPYINGGTGQEYRFPDDPYWQLSIELEEIHNFWPLLGTVYYIHAAIRIPYLYRIPPAQLRPENERLEGYYNKGWKKDHILIGYQDPEQGHNDPYHTRLLHALEAAVSAAGVAAGAPPGTPPPILADFGDVIHFANPLFRAKTALGNPLYDPVTLESEGELAPDNWWTFLGQPRYIRSAFWVQLKTKRTDSAKERTPMILVGYQGANGP